MPIKKDAICDSRQRRVVESRERLSDVFARVYIWVVLVIVNPAAEGWLWQPHLGEGNYLEELAKASKTGGQECLGRAYYSAYVRIHRLVNGLPCWATGHLAR
jgi:hypothetical protein